MLYRNLFIFFFLVSISSCTVYQPLDYDVMVPAKHSFQPEIKSVVLVDNSVPFKGKKVHKVETPGSKFTIDTIWVDDFSSIALSALKEELTERKFFDSVYIHPEPLKTSRRLINRVLSWQQVGDLCEKYNAEAVIAFEKNVYNTKIKVESMPDGLLFGYLDASGAVLWRGYNYLSKELIYRQTQKDTISWDAVGGNINYIATKLPKLVVSIEELGTYLGAKAADDIAPRWEKQKRGYYIAGNYHFIQAADHMSNKEYGEAIKLWKYVFDRSDKKVKARAAYNLTLVSELMGDYESAFYWMEQGVKAIVKTGKNVAGEDKRRLAEYNLYLDKRVKALSALKKQIGDI